MFFEKTRWFVLTLLFISIVVLIIQINFTTAGKMSPFQSVFETITLPVKRQLNRLSFSMKKSWESLSSRQDLKEENIRLKQKLEELNLLKQKLKEITRENEELRKLFQIKQRLQRKIVVAEVVGRDPSNWFDFITIDKGFLDGVEKDMPVITPQGLVGRIFQTSARSARVMIVLNPNSAVPCRIQKSRSLGILYGTGKDYCIMKYIEHHALIKVGDQVVTSGHGHIYPKELLVGKVIEIVEQKQSLFKSAKIKPETKFDRIEYVLVMGKERL